MLTLLPVLNCPTSDSDDMEDFSENIIFVLSNLGILNFTKNQVIESKKNDKTKQDDIIFYLSVPGTKGEKAREAKLMIIENTYKLLSGSYIRKEHVNSFSSHNYARLRKQLETDGFFSLLDSDCFFELAKDVDFTSPSAAAAVVRNSSMNGRKEWKLKNGASLDEYESKISQNY